MQNHIEAGRPSLGAPRSPRSTSSTNSSLKGSLRAKYPVGGPEQTSASPRMRSTRKRAMSLDVDSANQSRIAGPALDIASTISPPTPGSSAREQVCLCQPDPKIPRPRNAFILYRQHMQAQVVAQHPGLANPEISKIIGEQWKNQSPEVKSSWKQLAEEEKQRHQRQYPGYRYQPRRAGKTNGFNPVSVSPENGPTRCPKCNGRYISTPSTPLTPFTPGFGIQGPRSERVITIPFLSSRITEVERPPQSPLMLSSRIDSPRMVIPPHQSQHRQQYSPPQNLPTHYERDDEMDLLNPSHEQKRRRFNDAQRYSISSPTQYSQPLAFARSSGPERSGIPMSVGGNRSNPLPGSTIMSRPGLGPGHMGPPPQRQQSPRHPYTTRSSVSSTFGESLHLPPLQTQVPSSFSHQQPRSSITGSRYPRAEICESQARSVEAMVMTIPYFNKVKILSRISPPLVPSGPTSPSYETRGCIIAVEGFYQDLLRVVGGLVEQTLRGDDSCAVCCWETLPTSSPLQSGEGIETPRDTEMRDAPLSPKHLLSNDKAKIKISKARKDSVAEEADTNPFIEYLSIIASMHRSSHHITKHITTLPDSVPSTPPLFTSQQQSRVQNQQARKKRIPVALLPHGFSLTTSDIYASRIPINDSYAPIDHWQWMATLWRGIVGPDLTIYCVRAGQEELGRFGGVEVRGDGVVVVRVLEEERDRREGHGRKGRWSLDEKTARRLGFEVLEFVRGVEGVWERR